MNTKPTPGPYTFHKFYEGVAVRGMVEGVDTSIATFWDGNTFGKSDIERAEANARAWVDGMAAMKALERIRRVLRDDPLLPNERLQAIDKIITEAKP